MEKIYDILVEPKGIIYQKLLSFCLKKCLRGQLIVRNLSNLNIEAINFLNCLQNYDLKISEVKEWPGTILHNEIALAYNFSVTLDSINLLEEFTEGLYEWLEPDLPEDLCFFRTDNSGKVFLGSISHEKDAFLSLLNDEIQCINEETKGLIIQEH